MDQRRKLGWKNTVNSNFILRLENKIMDNITVITLNANDEQIETVLTVDELIYAWQHDIDIPTNDDTVVSCVLSETQLYFETFGELMEALTGSDRKDS